MHHPTDRIAHTTAFVTPVVEHWLEREIAQWVHPIKDRSDNPSHHERTLLPGHIQMHFITTSPLTYVTFKCCKHVIIFVILATQYGIPDEDCHMQLEESETCYYFCYFSNTVWNT